MLNCSQKIKTGYLVFFSLLPGFFSGCVELHGSRVLTRSLKSVNAFDQREGETTALATVKRVAILEFDNISEGKSFKAMSFSTKFANQLASRGQVKVIFPRQALMLTDKLNARIAKHNAELRKLMLLGKDPAKDRKNRLAKEGLALTSDQDVELEKLDPVRRVADAIKIGRLLKVDAIIMGVVTDYDPYYRPRIALTVKTLVTGRSVEAAKALAQLTQWGIPSPHTTSQGLAWYRQQVFDARDGGMARDIYIFARDHHTESSPYDTEIYMRSMDRYYEFVSGTLAGKFLNARYEAIAEAYERALAEGKRKHWEEKSLRKRIEALIRPSAELPDPNELVNINLKDRRERSWRPDIYGREHPDKVRNTAPEYPRGANVRKR